MIIVGWEWDVLLFVISVLAVLVGMAAAYLVYVVARVWHGGYWRPKDRTGLELGHFDTEGAFVSHGVSMGLNGDLFMPDIREVLAANRPRNVFARIKTFIG